MNCSRLHWHDRCNRIKTVRQPTLDLEMTMRSDITVFVDVELSILPGCKLVTQTMFNTANAKSASLIEVINIEVARGDCGPETMVRLTGISGNRNVGTLWHLALA